MQSGHDLYRVVLEILANDEDGLAVAIAVRKREATPQIIARVRQERAAQKRCSVQNLGRVLFDLAG
jgi:hypothetical protein